MKNVHKTRKTTLAWARLILPLAFLFVAAEASAQIRTTQSGLVKGTTVGSEVQFLGIPYAAPPLGALRWRPPSPPASWQGILSATAYGSVCPQYGMPKPNEDCLTINVFAPARARPGSKLPVLVYIYGGEFISGYSSMYDPSTLVTNGNLVAVTFNYRLGYLGFLAHPALSADDPNGVSGNYGILDQKAALNWVRNNIANFGGDPDQIAIFGQSAGGHSVLAQLILTNPVPMTAAIAESGGFQLDYPTLAMAEVDGEQVATTLGCPDQSLSCLQALSASTLENAISPFDTSSTIPVSPVIDAINFPSGLANAFASGNFERIPIINGGNHDEWRLFVGIDEFYGTPPLTADDYTAAVEASFGASAADVLAQYPVGDYATPDYAWAAVESDYVFNCNAHILDAQLSQYTPVYAFEMNDPHGPEPTGPIIQGFTYASAHASELSYLFPTLYAPVLRHFPPILTPAQKIMGGKLQDFWLSFAKNAYPHAPASQPWPAFTNATPQILSFVPPSTSNETGFTSDHKCSFWAPMLLQQAGLPSDAPY